MVGDAVRATLQRHVMPPATRPFAVDLGLAAGFFGAWLALSGFDPLVAAAMDELRLAVSPGPYHLRWPPPGPALFGLAGLVLAWIRHRFFGAGTNLQERLQRATLLAGALLAVRLLALFDSIVRIFPYLTMLWSPHALWALALVFLVYVHLPSLGARKPLRTATVAVALLAVCLPMYTFYALYFCQVTMLHGDEGQYLRVTQSLLHDGDMDLANNLGIEQVKEFHVRDFAVHVSPISPEGRVYPAHPIGLSVALAPAYWLGLEAWQNPRLSVALFVALLAGICIPLLFIFLVRLGAERWSALLATVVISVTGPYLLYSNQIYPEIPAIAIVLATLIVLAHWQIPRGRYLSLGRWEIPLLGLLTLLLCCLPLLHPRFGPLGLFCGALVLLQAWRNPRRWWALSTIGLVVAGGLYALLAYHYALGGDWLGQLRPGDGVWGENPMDIANWKFSLAGQWLRVDRGVLTTSPVFFVGFFGLLTLARLRDRRLLIAASLYVTTAGICGLHTMSIHGYEFAGRYMVTALPVLAIGMAWGLPPVLRRATTGFIMTLALVISIESVLHTLVLPESAYNAENLLGRSINHFYPFQIHSFGVEQKDLPLLDIAFWGVLTGALFIHPGNIGIRAAVVACAAFAPLAWSQSDVLASRLQNCRSYYMPRLSDGIERLALQFNVPFNMISERAAGSDGGIRASEGYSRMGMVGYSRLSTPRLGALDRGNYKVTFRGLQVDAPEGQVSGYLTLSRRYTLPAVSRWNTKSNYPLIGGRVEGDQSFTFTNDRPWLYYIHTIYAGTGELALDGIHATLNPLYRPPERKSAEIVRIPHPNKAQPDDIGYRLHALPKGRYRLEFKLSGSTFASFFERRPDPIGTAVFSLDQAERPMAQALHPPWWLSIPFVGEEAFDLHFVQDRARDVRVVLQYDGDCDLDLTEIVLYRETFDFR
ncbi:MAG: hypothetical protein OXU79_08365 [Gemmatimonadota bacterium]|nr:hypothetical protein [Gemmatimonadota bacterium]